MRISEVIEKLKDIQKRYGDLVVITCNNGGSGNVDEINLDQTVEGVTIVLLQERLR